MNYKIILLDQAQEDIFEEMLWYEEKQSGLGLSLERSLKAILKQLETYPMMYQIRYDETRIAFPDRFPYGLHYFIEDQKVYVTALVHQKDDPTKWTQNRD